MIIKLDRWDLKRFFHWWMCKRNPDKELEWLDHYAYSLPAGGFIFHDTGTTTVSW